MILHHELHGPMVIRSVGQERQGKQVQARRVSRLTSFDPRPKPLITLPSICSGKGGSGPESGPTIRGLVFPMVLGRAEVACDIRFGGEYNILIMPLSVSEMRLRTATRGKGTGG